MIAPSGAELIVRERRRQTDVETYSYRHDNAHTNDELVLAAVQYALPVSRREMVHVPGIDNDVPVDWPWGNLDWRPTPEDRVRELVKAGALIAAEIDRLARAAGLVHR